MGIRSYLSEGLQKLRIRAEGHTPLYADHRLVGGDAAAFLDDLSATPATYIVTADETDAVLQEYGSSDDAAALVADLNASRAESPRYRFDSWVADGHTVAHLSADYGEATQPQQLRGREPFLRYPLSVEVSVSLGGSDRTADDVAALLDGARD